MTRGVALPGALQDIYTMPLLSRPADIADLPNTKKQTHEETDEYLLNESIRQNHRKKS